MRWKIFSAYILGGLLFVAGTGVGLNIAQTSPVSASSSPLVYVCQRTPCANAQEFEVSDGNGAPIFSVGEYGGAATFGDNFKIFPPSTVYRPAVTESWESPAAYDRAFRLPVSCSAPSVWLEPGGIWACSSGRWVLKIRL